MIAFLKKVKQNIDRRSAVCSMVIAAAGASSRMGGGNKLLLPLAGQPVLVHTLLAAERARFVSEIVIAAREEDLLTYADLCKAYAISKPVKVIVGGASRTESVYRAALETRNDAGLIAVHDGARPLATPEWIDGVIQKAIRSLAVAPAVPVRDTIKVAEDGAVKETPNRAQLFAVQTPQVFDAVLLRAALQAALEEKAELTDDCAAMERLHKEVLLTETI